MTRVLGLWCCDLWLWFWVDRQDCQWWVEIVFGYVLFVIGFLFVTVMNFLGVCSYGFVFNMVVGLGYMVVVVVVLGRGFLIWWDVALRTMMMVVVDFGWQW